VFQQKGMRNDEKLIRQGNRIISYENVTTQISWKHRVNLPETVLFTWDATHLVMISPNLVIPLLTLTICFATMWQALWKRNHNFPKLQINRNNTGTVRLPALSTDPIHIYRYAFKFLHGDK
jgi:hypothetical protein